MQTLGPLEARGSKCAQKLAAGTTTDSDSEATRGFPALEPIPLPSLFMTLNRPKSRFEPPVVTM